MSANEVPFNDRKRSLSLPEASVEILDDDDDFKTPPLRSRRVEASNDETVLRVNGNNGGNTRGGRSSGGSRSRGAASTSRGGRTGMSNQNDENRVQGSGKKTKKPLTEIQRQERNQKARERRAKEKVAKQEALKRFNGNTLTGMWNVPPLSAPLSIPSAAPNRQVNPRPAFQLVLHRPPAPKQQVFRRVLAQPAAQRPPLQQQNVRSSTIQVPRPPPSQRPIRQLARPPLVPPQLQQPAQAFVFRVPATPGPCRCPHPHPHFHNVPRRLIIGGNTPDRTQKTPSSNSEAGNQQLQPDPVPGPSNAAQPPPPASVAGPSNSVPISHVHDLSLAKLPGIMSKLDAVKRVLADVENIWKVFGAERKDLWDQIDKTWQEVTRDFLHRSDVFPSHLISLLTQSPAYKTRNHTAYVASCFTEMRFFFSQIEKALEDEDQVLETGERYHALKALAYAPLKTRPEIRHRKYHRRN